MKSWNYFDTITSAHRIRNRIQKESTSIRCPPCRIAAHRLRQIADGSPLRRILRAAVSRRFREGRAKLALIRQTTIFASQNSHSKMVVFPQRSSGRAAAEWQRQFFFELPQNVPGCSRLRDQGKPLESN